MAPPKPQTPAPQVLLVGFCVAKAPSTLIKQTAIEYEAGRPDAQGRGKKFDVADLWDVLRTLRPTREMILASWSHSLEYSIGSSAHGSNVMTAVCEKLGLYFDQIFRRMPEETAEELVGLDNEAATELKQWMTECSTENSTGIGAKQASLDAVEAQLRESRKLRFDFRFRAIDKPQELQPVQSILAVVGRDDLARYADALFPSLASSTIYYKSKSLLTWAAGKPVELKGEVASGHRKELRFRQQRIGNSSKSHNDSGGAKRLDFGWLVLYQQGGGDRPLTWNSCAKEVKEMPNATIFDMHNAGVSDALFMLASSENSRNCPEMPKVAFTFDPLKAFVDENGSIPTERSTFIDLRPVDLQEYDDNFQPPRLNTRTYAAHDGQPLEVRMPDSTNHRNVVKTHEQLDRINQRGRLPALQPIMSTNIKRSPPIRKCLDGSQSVEVNSAVAYEHVHCLIESTLACSRIPGLAGLQERFASGGSAPPGLKSSIADQDYTNSQIYQKFGVDAKGIVKKLPYSIDIMQIHYSQDLCSRFYNSLKTDCLESFNAHIKASNLGEPLKNEDLPEFTLRYPGFPIRNDTDKTEALRLISIPSATLRSEDQAIVDVATASPLQDLSLDLLRYETSIAIGAAPTLCDIEAHKKTLIGSSYVFGISGDVFDYATFLSHLSESLLGRGNSDGNVDEYGKPTDAGFLASLDAEFMLIPRLREREAAAKVGEFPVTFDQPVGSTYRFMQEHAEAQQANVAGTKRNREEAPRSQFSVSSMLTSIYSSASVKRSARIPGERPTSRKLDQIVEFGDCRFPNFRQPPPS